MQSMLEEFHYLYKDIQRSGLSLHLYLNEQLQRFNIILTWPRQSLQFTTDAIHFYLANYNIFFKEVISGICVSTLMVPEVIAFSYAAHLQPEDGLFATVFMAIIATLFTKMGGMASGAAGALAVVTKELMDNAGPLGDISVDERREYVWLTIIFVGIIQMLVGYFKLAKFIKLIPETAMIGFLNGLSILIFITQLVIFKKCDGEFSQCSLNNTLYYMDIHTLELWLTILCVSQTIFIMIFFPKTPKIGTIIPSTLVALVFTTSWEHLINRFLLNQSVRTVGDISNINGHFPIPGLPQIANIRWGVVLLYAAMLALIGLCESIMTLATIGEKLEISMTAEMAVQESFAQGLANLTCGLFKTQGGGAMIAQAIANLHGGGRYRLSGITVGFSILILTTTLPMIINLVPIACLSGVLIVIVFKTFYWKTLFLVFKIPISDTIGILLVTVLAVLYNLAAGVIAGVIWTSLCTSCHLSELLKMTATIDNNEKTYKCEGPLYFGSSHQFIDQFDIYGDGEFVHLNLSECYILDYSGVAALDTLYRKYLQNNKTIYIEEVNEESMKLVMECRVDFLGKNIISNIESMELMDIQTKQTRSGASIEEIDE